MLITRFSELDAADRKMALRLYNQLQDYDIEEIICILMQVSPEGAKQMLDDGERKDIQSIFGKLKIESIKDERMRMRWYYSWKRWRNH